MARTTGKTPSKTQARKTAQTGGASKKRSASVTRARAMERGPSKTRTVSEARTTRRTQAPTRRRTGSAPASQNWSTLLNTLVTSSYGRVILADMLAAAAEALRKHKSDVQQAGEQGAQQVAQTGAAAIDAGAAAINAGVDVASATMNLAQSTAGTLAEMASDAATAILPGSATKEAGGRSAKGRSRKRT